MAHTMTDNEDGDDNTPWHSRGRQVSTLPDVEPDMRRDSALIYTDIMLQTKAHARKIMTDLQNTFVSREQALTEIVHESRFNTIEHFLEVEFERQRVDLCATLNSAVIGDSSGGTASGQATIMNDGRRLLILNDWHRRAIMKYESFMRRSRVIRSAFIRTFEFFRELTEAALQKLQDRHAREINLAKSINAMSLNKDDEAATAGNARSKHLEFTQMRERHTLEISNIRSENDKTSARELQLLEFHLQCTEDIIAADIAMLQKLTEKKLDDECTIARITLAEDRAAEDETRRERHSNAETLGLSQTDMRNLDQVSVDDDRKGERNARRVEFSKQGKSVVDDALYGLTFSMRDVDHPLDSVLESDHSDSDEDDDQQVNGATSAPIGVTRLQKNMKREAMNRRRIRKIAFMETIKATKKEQNAQTHLLQNKLKAGIDALYAKHVIQLKNRSAKWALQRAELQQTHELASKHLATTHTMDRHVLLQADLKENRSQKAQSDMKAQDVMSNHVFHEMRNLTASMMSIAESLVGSTEEELKDFAVRQSSICSYAVETMNNMLDIVKHQSGTYAITTTDVNLRDLVNHVVEIQGDRVMAGVHLKIEAQDAAFRLDEHLLTQFLITLLSNSCKFTEQGSIKIIARVADVFTTEGYLIELGVADTGIGIGADLYENMREIPAMNSNSQNEYMTRSSGYGIYLLRLIANTLGTHVHLLSPLPADHYARQQLELSGKGSYTYIRLHGMKAEHNGTLFTPSIVTDMAAKAELAWRFAPAGELRILVADDQKFVRVSMLQMLCKIVKMYPACSMKVTTVRSVEEAFRVTQTRSFDIIFMDQYFDQTLMLPDLPETLPLNPSPESVSQLELNSHIDLGAAVRDFSKNEIFVNQAGDGKAVGSSFVEAYTGDALCVVATGSPVLTLNDSISIMKPFNIASLKKAMERGYISFSSVKNRLIKVEDTLRLKSNEKATLFNLEASDNESV